MKKSNMKKKKEIIILFAAVMVGASVWLAAGCRSDGAGIPAIAATPTPSPEAPKTTLRMHAAVPPEATPRRWMRTPTGAIPMESWRAAEAIFREDHLSADCTRYIDTAARADGDGKSATSPFRTVEKAAEDLDVRKMGKSKGCKIVTAQGGAGEIAVLLQDDIKNQYDLFCSPHKQEKDAFIRKITKDYLNADETRTEIAIVDAQKELQARRGDPQYSSCRGELYEGENRMGLVFMDGYIFARIAEKFVLSSVVKDDTTGHAIVSEGVTGVIYALLLRDGRFYIAEKLRAPSLPAPGEETYTPHFP
jgi:hypothetical protein